MNMVDGRGSGVEPGQDDGRVSLLAEAHLSRESGVKSKLIR